MKSREPVDPTVGQEMRRLRKLRHGRSRNQVVVSKKMGIRREKLGEMENGKRLPELPELQKFCKALQLSSAEADSLLDKLKIYVSPASIQRPSLPEVELPLKFDPRAFILSLRNNLTPLDEDRVTDLARNIPEIIRLFDIPETEFFAALGEVQRTIKVHSQVVNSSAKIANTMRIIKERLVTQCLRRYYSPAHLAQCNLAPYAFAVDGIGMDTSMVCRAEWVDLSIKLAGAHEQCDIRELNLPPCEVSPQMLTSIATVLASTAQHDGHLWNGASYRQLDLDVSAGNLVTSFAHLDFFCSRFTSMLLLDELTAALLSTDFDVDTVLARSTELLPLRQQFYPPSANPTDFNNRIANVGIQVLFAVATEVGDFFIPIQRRSLEVTDKQGMLTLVPRGIHQPHIDLSAASMERNLSFSVYRELYEELFGGQDTERSGPKLIPNWFFYKSPALQWLREHPESHEILCTNVGITLATGDCEFGILFVVHDEQFWNDNVGELTRMWEASPKPEDNIHISSRDAQQLSQYMQMPEWDDGSLYTFIEGLQRLKALAPDRVNLPDIRRVTPIKA